MAKRTIKICKENVLVIGSLNGNKDKIEKINNISSLYKYVIINGNLFCNDFFDVKFNSNVIYCVGDLDLLNLSYNFDKIYDICNLPNIIEIKFSQSTYLVCSGGPNNNDIYASFMNTINNEPWHIFYNGKFGYVVSNNPYNIESPTFFNYSCSLGHKTKIFAQEINNFGLNKTFEL